MPGKRLFLYSEGDRAEDLATYVLSAFAAVVPVRRQADYGADLLCTITHRERNALYAGRSFEAQVKLASEVEIRYGGLDDRGSWKEYELQWLYGQDQPVILCVVDQEELDVKLYSTIRIWGARYQWGRMGEIVLIPDELLQGEGAPDHYTREPLAAAAGGAMAGDGYSYRVPLGNPIVEMSLAAEARVERDTIRQCMTQWISLDYTNIRHHKMGIPYVEEPQSWEPNVPLGDQLKVWHFSNPRPGQNVTEILKSLAPGVGALINNFKHQRQYARIAKIKPFSELLSEYDPADIIVPQLLRDADKEERENSNHPHPGS